MTDPGGAFYEDLAEDMKDPEFAKAYTEALKGMGLGHQRTAPYSLDECEHLNTDTTYEDSGLWQGMCYDCGAELEETFE